MKDRSQLEFYARKLPHGSLEARSATAALHNTVSRSSDRFEWTWDKILQVLFFSPSQYISIIIHDRGCRGHDHMIVEFITTYTISAYHH
jgi:hypothetical protein